MDDREYADVLRRAMQELTEHFAHPTEIDDTLRGVTESCVDLIDGVESADVLLIAGPDLFKSVAATSPLAVEIDDLQKRFREGPCLDAAIDNPIVMCNDLRDDQRWPSFSDGRGCRRRPQPDVVSALHPQLPHGGAQPVRNQA